LKATSDKGEKHDLHPEIPQMSVQILSTKPCPSTHGLDGYALGSYWDGDDIICGYCGTRIKNPIAFGRDAHGQIKFPDWISGQKGVRYGI
jgi:hypothetical protein